MRSRMEVLLGGGRSAEGLEARRVFGEELRWELEREELGNEVSSDKGGRGKSRPSD